MEILQTNAIDNKSPENTDAYVDIGAEGLESFVDSLSLFVCGYHDNRYLYQPTIIVCKIRLCIFKKDCIFCVSLRLERGGAFY